jgi:hypothetical protein
MRHDLKTWPQYFNRILDREKKFELRKNDRDFQVGDTLLLLEWFPETKEFTGRELAVKVTYILHGPAFGIEQGYCVMSIQNIAD